jgi:hypothetical protein
MGIPAEASKVLEAVEIYYHLRICAADAGRPSCQHSPYDEPAAEASAENLNGMIPPGMSTLAERTGEKGLPPSPCGFSVHDLLEVVKIITSEAGLQMRFVYGCEETEGTRHESLNISLKG